MKHIDIFTGIGGWPLGFSWAFGSAYEPVAFCERDNYAMRVLKKHWPDVPIVNDVFDMKGGDYGAIDILSCSPPCQPYSVAGKRRGSADDRALWPQVARTLQEMVTRPRWICIENVPGFITIERGMALESLLTDLEALGYACWTVLIPAVAFDAPHIRQRTFIVAHSNESGLAQHEGECGNPPTQLTASVGSDWTVPDTHPIGRNGRAGVLGPGRGDQPQNGGAVAPQSNGKQAERAAISRPECREWLPESGVGRVASRVPNRLDRLRCLGNAVVPQVAEFIGQLILEADNGG